MTIFVISFILVFVSLFISFFEITISRFTSHPKTTKLIRNLFIVLSIICLIPAYIEFDATNHINIDQFNRIKTLEKIDSASKFEIEKLRTENNKEHKQFEDSLENNTRIVKTTALDMSREFADEKSFNLQDLEEHKKTQKKIDRFDSLKLPPTLTILNNPSIQTVSGEDLFSLDFKSLNSEAHIDYLYYALISTVGLGNANILDTNNYKCLKQPFLATSSSINFTSIIPKDDPYNYSIFCNRNNYNITDTVFLALECGYKSKNNIRQTPLRKIY